MVVKVMIVKMMKRIVNRYKIGILKSLTNFTEKHLCRSFFLTKLQALGLTWTQLFSYEICKLFQNTFFYRTPLAAASENNEQQQLSEGFANSCYKIVSPILLQELINDFAVCKHCSGTLLLVEDSHDFGN